LSVERDLGVFAEFKLSRVDIGDRLLESRQFGRVFVKQACLWRADAVAASGTID
jgi:hypothetical protein